MSTSHARDALLKVRWEKGDIRNIVVRYISRGSPGGVSVVRGCDVSGIGRSFITLEDGTMLPYHRLVSIEEGPVILWSRRPKDVDVEDHHVLGG